MGDACVGAAPFRPLALEVGPGERPLAVLARRRMVVAALDGGCLAQRRDGADAAVHAAGVERLVVVALVGNRGGDREAALARRVDQVQRERGPVLRLGPHLPYAHYALACVCHRRQRFREAEAAIEEAFRNDPENAEFHARWAAILTRLR